MKQRTLLKHLKVIVIFLICFLQISASAMAFHNKAPSPKRSLFLIMIDESISMDINDPRTNRYRMLRDILQDMRFLFSETNTEVYIGIIPFSTSVYNEKYGLTPPTLINGIDLSIDEIIEKIDGQPKKFRHHTYFYKGFSKAIEMIESFKSDFNNISKHIILVSDGVDSETIETLEKSKQLNRLLDNLVNQRYELTDRISKLKSLNTKIHCISLNKKLEDRDIAAEKLLTYIQSQTNGMFTPYNKNFNFFSQFYAVFRNELGIKFYLPKDEKNNTIDVEAGFYSIVIKSENLGKIVFPNKEEMNLISGKMTTSIEVKAVSFENNKYYFRRPDSEDFLNNLSIWSGEWLLFDKNGQPLNIDGEKTRILYFKDLKLCKPSKDEFRAFEKAHIEFKIKDQIVGMPFIQWEELLKRAKGRIFLSGTNLSKPDIKNIEVIDNRVTYEFALKDPGQYKVIAELNLMVAGKELILTTSEPFYISILNNNLLSDMRIISNDDNIPQTYNTVDTLQPPEVKTRPDSTVKFSLSGPKEMDENNIKFQIGRTKDDNQRLENEYIQSNVTRTEDHVKVAGEFKCCPSVINQYKDKVYQLYMSYEIDEGGQKKLFTQPFIESNYDNTKPLKAEKNWIVYKPFYLYKYEIIEKEVLQLHLDGGTKDERNNFIQKNQHLTIVDKQGHSTSNKVPLKFDNTISSDQVNLYLINPHAFVEGLSKGEYTIKIDKGSPEENLDYEIKELPFSIEYIDETDRHIDFMSHNLVLKSQYPFQLKFNIASGISIKELHIIEQDDFNDITKAHVKIYEIDKKGVIRNKISLNDGNNQFLIKFEENGLSHTILIPKILAKSSISIGNYDLGKPKLSADGTAKIQLKFYIIGGNATERNALVSAIKKYVENNIYYNAKIKPLRQQTTKKIINQKLIYQNDEFNLELEVENMSRGRYQFELQRDEIQQDVYWGEFETTFDFQSSWDKNIRISFIIVNILLGLFIIVGVFQIWIAQKERGIKVREVNNRQIIEIKLFPRNFLSAVANQYQTQETLQQKVWIHVLNQLRNLCHQNPKISLTSFLCIDLILLICMTLSFCFINNISSKFLIISNVVVLLVFGLFYSMILRYPSYKKLNWKCKAKPVSDDYKEYIYFTTKKQLVDNREAIFAATSSEKIKITKPHEFKNAKYPLIKVPFKWICIGLINVNQIAIIGNNSIKLPQSSFTFGVIVDES